MAKRDAISRFQLEYQEYHALSADRRTEQVKAIQNLAQFSEKKPAEITADDLKAWLSAELARGLAPTTVNKKLNMVRAFFKWCWQAGLMDADRLLTLRAVEPPRGSNKDGIPRPYTRKELDQFRHELAVRWPTTKPKFWERWRRGTSPYKRIAPHAQRIQIEAMVSLALHCGLRRSEIFHAAVDDIHYDNAYVVVIQGKGGKDREVPHTKHSRACVKAWLDLRAELKPDHDSTWLSLAHAGVATRPMHWDRFRKILLTIGDWQFHRLRHTAGTEWLRATKRIEIVQQLLGHSRIQQTLVYAQLVREDLHDAVAKAELKFEEAVGA